MYLKQVRIEGFRSCYRTTVELQPEITIFVGENNSGKSNVIDAIRLATPPLSGRRTRYFEESDLSRGCGQQDIAIEIVFANLSDAQQGLYYTATDTTSGDCLYQTRFNAQRVSGGKLGRPTQSAGPLRAPDAEPEARDRICHVYLAPLRDAQKELDSPEAGRLAHVMQLLTEESERDELLNQANTTLGELQGLSAVTKTSSHIQRHIDGLTMPVRGQRIASQFTDFTLRKLIRSLRLKMAESGLDLADLQESGLGYANLLFIATVLLELQNAERVELTVFLVEEPEAHLHPQLQAVLLDYLRDHARASVRDDTQSPAGRIQVVCTTHSPNLASSIEIENIVVLRGIAGAAAGGPPANRTSVIPVAALPLDSESRRKISRYLDATKASLLFGKRIMLVEGLAEVILMPVLARKILREERTKLLAALEDGDVDSFAASPFFAYLVARHTQEVDILQAPPDANGVNTRADFCSANIELLKETLADQSCLSRLFSAVTLIGVGGVDFSPYVRLLLAQVESMSIVDHVVVVTDADPGTDDDPAVDRQAILQSVAAGLGDAARISVFLAPLTLEADLAGDISNHPILKAAYLKQHPKSQAKWEAIETAANPAEEFYAKLRADSNFISKGDFAQSVAARIEDGEAFCVPSYIERAILSVLGVPQS